MPRHFGWWALDMATSLDNAIPRNSYLFGASWPHVCRTLLAAVEQNRDPYAVMVSTAEIIRFYYGPSTRLRSVRSFLSIDRL